MEKPQSLLLVGCGNMGGAMLRGWVAQGLDLTSVAVVDPTPAAAAVCEKMGVTHLNALSQVDQKPGVVIFAVKPQLLAEVVPQYREMGADILFISVAAGVRLAGYEQWLGDVPLVRAMPNTPAAIQQGITVLCANNAVTASMRSRCESLLTAIGEVVWLEQEELMDAVTGVSGSGPAYVFLFIEALTQAGITAGLPAAMAERLAKATVAGAGQLALPEGTSAAVLREKVSSPGGTTVQALSVLTENNALEDLLLRAVRAAAQRSKELS
jgi:pyrroline-5-carboxylate reductase